MKPEDGSLEGRSPGAAHEEPQVYGVSRAEGRWRLTRRTFLGLTAAIAAAHGPGALVYARKAAGAEGSGQLLRVTWYLKNNTDEPWSEEARLRLVDEAFTSNPESIPVPPARPGDVVPVQVELRLPEGEAPQAIQAALLLPNGAKPVMLPLILNKADLRATATLTPTRTPTATATATRTPCAVHICSCVGDAVCVALCSCVKDTICVALCPCVGDFVCVTLCSCVSDVCALVCNCVADVICKTLCGCVADLVCTTLCACVAVVPCAIHTPCILLT